MGVVLAILVAILFRKTIFKSHGTPFVMELPPYRMPTFRSTIKHMWFKGSQYLKKMGGVILIASILLWALGYFPREVQIPGNTDRSETIYQSSISIKSSNIDQDINTDKIQLENSYIGRIGKLYSALDDDTAGKIGTETLKKNHLMFRNGLYLFRHPKITKEEILKNKRRDMADYKIKELISGIKHSIKYNKGMDYV